MACTLIACASSAPWSGGRAMPRSPCGAGKFRYPGGPPSGGGGGALSAGARRRHERCARSAQTQAKPGFSAPGGHPHHADALGGHPPLRSFRFPVYPLFHPRTKNGVTQLLSSAD